MNEPSTAQIIKGFPEYLFVYLWALFNGILSDVTLTSLAFASAAVGYETGWPWGVAAFFGGHYWIKITNARGQAVVRSGKEVGTSLQQLASIFTLPPPLADPDTPVEVGSPDA